VASCIFPAITRSMPADRHHSQRAKATERLGEAQMREKEPQPRSKMTTNPPDRSAPSKISHDGIPSLAPRSTHSLRPLPYSPSTSTHRHIGRRPPNIPRIISRVRPRARVPASGLQARQRAGRRRREGPMCRAQVCVSAWPMMTRQDGQGDRVPCRRCGRGEGDEDGKEEDEVATHCATALRR
jgi:hypothetical protein